MNALTVLKATNATIDQSQRRFIATVWALITLVSIAFLQLRGVSAVPVLIYSSGLAFWWAFVAARALLVQRDARSLRIPDVDRTVAANLLLQYALSALLPAALLALAGFADFQRSAAFLSCVVAAALLFQALPRYLGMFMAIIPSCLQVLHAHGFIPGLSDPEFVRFGWCLAAVMAAVAAWRWLASLDARPGDCASWTTPLVLQLSRPSTRHTTLNNWDTHFGAPDQSGLNRVALLDGAAPGASLRALRVWLGGAFVPVDAQTRLKQIASVLMPMLIVIAFCLLGRNSSAGWTVFAVFVGGTLFPLMIMSVAPARLQRLHTDASGELSLLALLPGIDSATAKRELLAAALGLPAKALGCFYAFVVVVMLILGGSAAAATALTVCTLAALALATALSLSIVAAKPVPRIVTLFVCILGPILVFTTPTALLIHAYGRAFELAGRGLFVGWLTLCAVLVWLLVRGYTAYLRRPHAFLLNDR